MSRGFRIRVLVMTWLATAVILAMMMKAGLLLRFNGVLMTMAILVAAVTVTVIIRGAGRKVRPAADVVVISKPKPDPLSEVDPFSLLTPDDLDELRTEFKEQLRQRLLEGSEGELGSLDALLADQDETERHS